MSAAGEEGNEGIVRSDHRQKLMTYALLHGILLLYSLAAVCSKMASTCSFGSIGFFAWYGGVLLILAIYAIAWQQVLRRLPLTVAFANKGVTIIWGILWGSLIFGESIEPNMVIGAAIVFTGVMLVVTARGQ
ncbi:MAG: transporter [Raoultibacter sp.]